MTDCPLCVLRQPEAVLWQDALCRVIDVADPAYAGYCRVVWNDHVREMSDLPPEQRHRVMTVVYAVEESLRTLLRPAKVNLASLGNQVPHLHWHVIPRFPDDPHFPDAIWAQRRRPDTVRRFDPGELRHALRQRLS